MNVSRRDQNSLYIKLDVVEMKAFFLLMQQILKGRRLESIKQCLMYGATFAAELCVIICRQPSNVAREIVRTFLM